MNVQLPIRGRDKLLTVKQVSKYYAVSPRTVWNRVKSGALPDPIKWEGTTRWRLSDIQRHIASLAD